MSKTIWKFPVDLDDVSFVRMPQGAVILSAQAQNETLTLWAVVDPKRPTITRKIRIIGTGRPIDVDLPYIGTVQMMDGRLVWHLFDKGEVDL